MLILYLVPLPNAGELLPIGCGLSMPALPSAADGHRGADWAATALLLAGVCAQIWPLLRPVVPNAGGLWRGGVLSLVCLRALQPALPGSCSARVPRSCPAFRAAPHPAPRRSAAAPHPPL